MIAVRESPVPIELMPRDPWRWAALAVAALAMVATLPGRTHGLGLITEPLLNELRLDRVAFADINLWATLIGALFCLPFGWLTDRIGSRAALTGVVLALGAVVLAMSRLPAEGSLFLSTGTDFFLLVLLTRGLGQSALSVGSLTLMGQAAGPRGSCAMGVYSVLVSLGFMGAFGAAKVVLGTWHAGWRELWAGIGWVLVLGVAPICALAVRERRLVRGDRQAWAEGGVPSRTLWAALRTPAFWVFAAATSLYGLIVSGISLFNQSILAERHFDRDMFLTITVMSPFVGLVGNLATGYLAQRYGMGRLLTVAMCILTAALAAFPLVETLEQVYAYAVAMGFAGGMVTVIFFGAWVRLFGPAHLGAIQGAAQMLTVIASAVGPLLFALCQQRTGSYAPLFEGFAAASAVLALAAWLIREEKT